MIDWDDWMLLLQKISVTLLDIDSDNENDTDSNYGFSDFGRLNDSSDLYIYWIHKQLLVSVFLKTAFKGFSKFLRKYSENIPCVLQLHIFYLQFYWNWTLQWIFFLRVLQILLG